MRQMTLDDLKLDGHKVLVRVDFNVPIEAGKVTDDTRILAALPTVKRILDEGGAAILMSHLGRPKGKVNPKYSLKPVAARLEQLLGKPVQFASDCVGTEAVTKAAELEPGQVLLLENLRFHPEEEKNDREFAHSLARLGELYVNDAFGSAHRAHASTAAVAEFFDEAAAGYLMERELQHLGDALDDPKRPFVALLGGAKISGKIDVIEHLLGKVDRILIGGGMAFTFLKSQGIEVGKSLVEADRVEMATEILKRAGNDKLVLPVDCVAADDIDTGSGMTTVPIGDIPANKMGLDIGPATIDQFAAALQGAGTIVWNGPMGVFEKDAFAVGTIQIARAVANATDAGAVSVIGGGDSASAVIKAGVADRITHISTGGGASLEFLEGKVLPGVAALKRKV